MKIPMPTYRCPLARMQAEVTDLDAMKQRGWRDQNILVVNVADERLDLFEREFVKAIGERLYGGARRG
jgi:hypothetical protein